MAITITRKVLLYSILLINSFLVFHTQLGNARSSTDHHHPFRKCHFDRIYQFGDSISDTGNLILEGPVGAATRYARLPYGLTFFGNATGRCSNGLLMIDFIAMDAGLPFLNPYKSPHSNFSHGVNFAVAGSTALSTQDLARNNIICSVTNSSLHVQIDWFSKHLHSICHKGRDCREEFKNTLFMLGEIGGNDYNYAYLQGKTIEEARTIVPDVVDAIKVAVKRVIGYGASRIVVPGNFPVGCFPVYLDIFQTNNSEAYDDHRCSIEVNDFVMYHNEHLQRAIEELKREHPNTIIVYGDYYNAFQWLFHHIKYFGFDPKLTQKSCCGTGGDYNFDVNRMCGVPGVPVCSDPHRYVSWDGLHLTQKSYRILTTWLVSNLFPKLQCIS